MRPFHDTVTDVGTFSQYVCRDPLCSSLLVCLLRPTASRSCLFSFLSAVRRAPSFWFATSRRKNVWEYRTGTSTVRCLICLMMDEPGWLVCRAHPPVFLRPHLARPRPGFALGPGKDLLGPLCAWTVLGPGGLDPPFKLWSSQAKPQVKPRRDTEKSPRRPARLPHAR